MGNQYEVIHIPLHLFQIGFHYTAQAGPRTDCVASVDLRPMLSHLTLLEGCIIGTTYILVPANILK